MNIEHQSYKILNNYNDYYAMDSISGIWNC